MEDGDTDSAWPSGRWQVEVTLASEPVETQEQDAEPGLVSVVIPVRNEATTLPDQFSALAQQTYRGRWEVVISDNGSTDGSQQIAIDWTDRLPSLRVVDSSQRPGIGHARNVGARVASGSLIALCDGDDRCEPGWLEAMVEGLRKYDLVGGRLDVSDNDPIAIAWRRPFPSDGLPVALGFLPYAIGANCAVRKQVVEALGGWREDYENRAGVEDVEFSWRAQLANYRIGFAPDAVVRYRYRSGLISLAKQFYRYGLMEPKLYKEFRRAGVARSSIKVAVKAWLWMLLHLPDLIREPEARGVWVRKAAYRSGRLVGSLRAGVIFL